MKSEHIFIIDDDKFFAKYFIMRFRLLVNDDVEFHHFTGLRPMITAKSSIVPSLILLDNELNGEHGVESIPELTEMYPNTDVILISAMNAKELSEYALKNGATRFISKDDIMMDKIAERINEELSDTKQNRLLRKLMKT